MPWELDARFRTRDNAQILSFIERENPSAHDEAATALTAAARGLSDVAWYCPDKHAYAYFVLHTRAHRIFGIAFGMSCVGFALPPGEIARAVAEGGEPDPSIGAGWVVWRIGTSADLGAWCKLAHDHAARERPEPRARRPR